MYLKQLSLRILLWQTDIVKETDNLKGAVIKSISKLLVVLFFGLVLFIWRGYLHVRNYSEQKDCLRGKRTFGGSTGYLLIQICFLIYALFHMLVLYMYIVLIIKVLRKQKDYLMCTGTEDVVRDLIPLVVGHILTTVLIIITTWSRFFIGFRSDDLSRVTLHRIGFLGNYVGMIL
eukprot:UN33066